MFGFVVCLAGIILALFAFGPNPAGSALAQGSRQPNVTAGPDIIRMVGPVRLDQDLRNASLRRAQGGIRRATTNALSTQSGSQGPSDRMPPALTYVQSLLKSIWRPAPSMPGPILTFEGQGNTCGCQPSDTDGDIGPNHYVEAINESIRIFDKSGNTLSGPTSYNSFFAGLVGTPCATSNDGDPYVIYDKAADRWMISDFAFPSFPGSFILPVHRGVSDPRSGRGGWFLYAIQVDPGNPTYLGDYPKFALWNSGGSPAQNAYFLTMNLFSNNTTFNGVRAYALDRASMLAGGPANAIGFTLSAADVGDPIASSPRTIARAIRRLQEGMKWCWPSIARRVAG